MKAPFYRNKGKRLMDVIVATLTLPLQLLVFVVVAPRIRREDGGPVIYRGPRIGRDGTIFTMYKYRTMSVGAPDLRNADGSTYNATEDTRVTRIGRVMRRSSVDELPQLINVLRGDMSLIGPRPNLATTDLRKLSSLERKRLEIRPGITGYNQAYFRNSVSVQQMYENDAAYVDRLSFVLDLRILGRTIVSVLGQRNINASKEVRR